MSRVGRTELYRSLEQFEKLHDFVVVHLEQVKFVHDLHEDIFHFCPDNLWDTWGHVKTLFVLNSIFSSDKNTHLIEQLYLCLVFA